jgi:hypothetical protein
MSAMIGAAGSGKGMTPGAPIGLQRASHYLFSQRHCSVASRIASPRLHFFLSIHPLISASFPSFEVVMKTLLKSCSIRGSILWAFQCRKHKTSAVPARSAIATNKNVSCIAFSRLHQTDRKDAFRINLSQWSCFNLPNGCLFTPIDTPSA